MGEPEYPVRIGSWRVEQLIVGQDDDIEGVLSARQEHGGVVVSAEECVSQDRVGDGIVVRESGCRVGVLTADCMPLVVATEHAAAVLHVSRKSLIHGLLDKIDDVVNPETIRGVYVGPHICPQHFTFDWLGEELRQFQMLFPRAIEWQKPWQISLRCAVQSYFDQWHLPLEQVAVDDRCTYDCQDLPSYRRFLEEGRDPQSTRLVTTVWRE